jgi:hypothetical protein
LGVTGVPGYSEYLANMSRFTTRQPLSPIHYERLERLCEPSLRLLRDLASDGQVSKPEEFAFPDGLGYYCVIAGSYLVAMFEGPVRPDNTADVAIWSSPEKPTEEVGPTGEVVFRHSHSIPETVEFGMRYQVALFEFIRNWVETRKPGTAMPSTHQFPPPGR